MGSAVFSPSAAAFDKKAWVKKIVGHIQKNHIYPRSAVRKGLEGTAKVKLVLTRDGTISSYEVLEASGVKQLDKVIPRIVKKMDPMPTPPADAKDSDLSLTIPLTWRLR